jgi:uracil-DNA glycosylase
MLTIPPGWLPVLSEETTKPYFLDLERFLESERAAHEVYPPAPQVFAALESTPFSDVRVAILGQDPYHDQGQAHGLCFSTPPGTKTPPSLVNILKELQADLGCPPADCGCLLPWARQGVLLLNTILTVRAHEPLSHRNKGWEGFTDAIIRKLNERPQPMVFVLWGGPAKKKRDLIAEPRHAVIEAAHPSPLSAHSGFFGSRPFSTINGILDRWGQPQIDWRLPPPPRNP